MRALGFETLLADQRQAPIIVTFLMPADPKFEFQSFYDTLAEQGYVIYPGKLTEVDSFRIGCIGHVDAEAMRGVLDAVRRSLSAMGVCDLRPARGGSGTSH
jgi:2-aminoethylphosphonate-pyruvate transaminase